MKYIIIVFCAVLTMVSCGKKAHEGTNEEKKIATTVVFRELPIALDLPSLPPSLTEAERKNWMCFSQTTLSKVSDKLLAGFGDYAGLLKDPLYNNWKTVGPIHNSSYTARLVEVSFDGPRPSWFSYKLADEILDSAKYDDPLGLHDLVNLVSKYGDALPADTPIIGFASVAAYYSYAYMNVGKRIQVPTVVKRNGKWELWDLRILYPRSFSDFPYHPPLFLVDLDVKDWRQPLGKVKIFLDPENVSKP
jgi:hypothetical protein